MACWVSYLSPIEIPSAEIIQLLRCELGPFSGRGDFIRLLNKGSPDLRFCFLTQLIVFDAKVYSTLDRLIEDGHSVCCEYHCKTWSQ